MKKIIFALIAIISISDFSFAESKICAEYPPLLPPTFQVTQLAADPALQAFVGFYIDENLVSMGWESTGLLGFRTNNFIRFDDKLLLTLKRTNGAWGKITTGKAHFAAFDCQEEKLAIITSENNPDQDASTFAEVVRIYKKDGITLLASIRETNTHADILYDSNNKVVAIINPTVYRGPWNNILDVKIVNADLLDVRLILAVIRLYAIK